MSAKKAPTLKEKVEVYERLLHDIQLHSTLTMRPQAVKALIDKICAWSYAHRSGNGEISDKEQQERINQAFRNLSKR